MVACWQIWIRRNKTIFEDDFQRPTDHTYMILKMVEDIDTPNILLMFANVTLFSLVGKDLRGWVKLNCDGAYKDSSGLASCGGLFQNSDGRWIKGYLQKFGTCDALCANMWGMYLRMQLAWRQGFHNLQVESDSKTLVTLITRKVKINGKPPTLIRRIQDLLNLNWQVHFNHTWREGNRSADWMTNFNFSLGHSCYGDSS